jgi:hypothetical protein
MWFYNDQVLNEVPDGYIGFVYLITNITNGRKYIGRKLFHASKTKQVKGKKKKFKVESDWKEYYSSSEELKKEVSELGPENFLREIIHLVKTKGALGYLESKEIFVRGCLESDDWYNGWVSCRVRKPHLKELKNQ